MLVQVSLEVGVEVVVGVVVGQVWVHLYLELRGVVVRFCVVSVSWIGGL